VEAYRAAQKAESRRWVAHRMTPQLMHCLELQGRFDLAGEAFLHLVAQDPETPYFAAVPLAWRSSTADAAVYARAKTWLENEREPIALLLGASWLLSGPERPRAIGVLTTLSTHSDRRIARLAAAQLWRTKLVSASSADVTRWQVQVANMPETLRGGPMLVLGDALQRQRRTDDAALAYLQASLRYSDRELLAAEGLLAAARLLENARREGDAQRLYRELQAKHSAFAHVNEVVVPHSTASAGTQP
jgi:tetratricopeptide (TPR) repeat protein